MRFTTLILFLSVLPALPALAQEQAVPETAAAQYRTVPREYRLDGIVEAVHRTTVSAQTQGQVQEILFDVDDFVEKNAIVARLKDTEHRARVTQAAAELKSATAQHEQARDEHERVKGLHGKGLVSDSAMDAAIADLKGAQARFEAATAGLEQAQEQLKYTQIRAPYSGIVTHRHVELGEIAGPGQPVMSGISLEELRVIVDVPQSVIPAVREGKHVRVLLPDGTLMEAAKVTVFPFADLGSNTFKVRLDLPEGTKKLFPGMFVKTGFVTGEKRELVVPGAAVVYRSEVTGVYVLNGDDRWHFRQIRVGRALDGELVVLAGLDEGERVALDPIAAGVMLKTQSAEKKAEGHNG
ncbi:MAG: efflux RND transporter periplasmic adaptor subunit [Pseudomonadota bacterium]|nr:efflux RND transporter periplasmic adaptor subunit [Pseudomonadota bacterium]